MKMVRKRSRSEKHDEINVYKPKHALYHGIEVKQDGENKKQITSYNQPSSSNLL